ncbi:MAG: PKD domain-containing protein [Candidatus Hydrogenedentales bacterium]
MSVNPISRHWWNRILLLLAAATLILPSCTARKTSAILVPSTLTFGRSLSQLELSVTPNIPLQQEITLAASDPWMLVSPTVVKQQLDGKATVVTVRIARHLMKPAGNKGELLVQAPGIADIIVPVTADVVLAADFTRDPGEVLVGHPVSFSNSSSAVSGLETDMKCHWDFGDGTSSTEQNPVHAYESPGSFDVALSVTSGEVSDVRTWEKCVQVIRPQAPQADFSVSNRQPAPYRPVQFVDLSVPGTGPLTRWLWDFGDGASSDQPSPTHIYTAAAVYDVYLTVTSPYGVDTEIKIGYIGASSGATGESN